MGATDFTATSNQPTVEAAFREAHELAVHDYGHGGYSGSLAEKGSYTVIDQTQRTYSQAEDFAYELISKDDPRISDKWGPAGALPYWDLKVTGTREKTIRVRVTADEAMGNPAEYHIAYPVLAAAASKHTKKGETVTRIKAGTPTKVRAVKKTAATKGATVKVFILRESNNQNYHVRNLSEHPTMAAARAAMEAAVDRACDEGRAAYFTIGCETRREDGNMLATGQVTVDYAEYEITATFTTHEAPAAGANPTGWLFFGMASS